MASHLRPDNIKTDYPFLAHPPPRKRSLSSKQSTVGHQFPSITAWAAHVHPGSPASPSPRRCPSLGKSRRPSAASIRTRTPSASFLHIAPTPTTATPSARDFKPNLTTLGYTSVFLQLPNTPVSATLALSVHNIPVPPHPSPCKPRGFTRFRSLSILRSRGRSKSARPDSPTKMRARAIATSASVVKRKKAKYAIRPPPLVNELALMQFADGGSMDCNIQRMLEAQAKAAGTPGPGDIYRDAQGGLWWDQDEEWEYAHLLAECDEASSPTTTTAVGATEPQWVTFGGSTSPSAPAMPGDDRRGSVSSQDSDLDPKYIVQPSESLDSDEFGSFGGIVPLATRKPVPLLLPRPRRTAKHLRKPDFVVDAAFSRLHSPKTPTFSPISPSGKTKPRGKARRRPAPLKLSPPSPALKRPVNSPIDADKARRDFIESSFEPMAVNSTLELGHLEMPVLVEASVVEPIVECTRAVHVHAPWRTVNDGLKNLGMSIRRKPSALNMMGLFRSATKKEDMAC